MLLLLIHSRLLLRVLLLKHLILPLHLEFMQGARGVHRLRLFVVELRLYFLFLISLADEVLFLLCSVMFFFRIQILNLLDWFDACLILERRRLVDHGRIIDCVASPNTQLLLQVRIMLGDIALKGHDFLLFIMQLSRLILKLRLQRKIGLS